MAILAGGKSVSKQARQILRRDPFAVILDADPQTRRIGGLCNVHLQFDLMRLQRATIERVLGIADQINQDLQHEVLIEKHQRHVCELFNDIDLMMGDGTGFYASISGYGQGGPLSHRSAYAPTVHAESGFLAMAIEHMGEDLLTARHDPFSHADVYTGLEAAIGILAALHHRERTGEGQYVDIAMAATMLSVNERVHAVLSDVDTGAEPIALGPAWSPFFRTSTGELITIATSMISSLTFPFFLAAMRRGDLAKDPRFGTAEARKANALELHRIFQQWVLTFSTIETLDAQLDEAKLAFGVVRPISDFVESEWSKWWGAVMEVDDRNGGVVRIPGRPWHFSGGELRHPGRPAFRGEHNAEVLKELGMPDAEIARLEQKGAIISAIPSAAS